MNEKKELVDRYFASLLLTRYPASDTKTAKLAESVAYSLMSGGKRIRPIMTLMICELYRPFDEQAIALSATSELIHTASLMLDDLPSMDNASYRRGRPTNHSIFGEATTILAAMALWSEAIRILSTIKDVEINDIVRETAETVGQKGLVRGQFLDLHSRQVPQTVSELEECAYLKTAVLFKNAAKIGALLGKAPPREELIWERFGREFGIVYQIRDDILDAIATTDETGKDAHADSKNGRTTYATLLGITGAKRLMSEKIATSIQELKRLPHDTRQLIAIVQSLVNV